MRGEGVEVEGGWRVKAWFTWLEGQVTVQEVVQINILPYRKGRAVNWTCFMQRSVIAHL